MTTLEKYSFAEEAKKLISEFSIIPVRGPRYAEGATEVERKKDAKRPLTQWTFYQEKRASLQEIENWGKKWPHAGLAIVTGAISDDLVVLDLDNVSLAKKALEKLIPDSLVFPIAGTPSGGEHWYFRTNQKISNSCKIIPGVDIRGEGGYVCAPPTSGYFWQNGLSLFDVAVPELPQPGIDFLNSHQSKKKEFFPSGKKESLAELYKGRSEGARNDSLARLAGSWVNDNLSFELCLENAHLWNEKNTPPLEEGEIFQTVRSIYERHKRRGSTISEVSAGEKIDSKEPGLELWAGQLFNLGDAYKEREPLQYLVDGLFVLPSLHVLYGAPGDLKTMLMQDCAISVAAGVAWLDRPVVQTPVLWLDFDNGKRRTHERVEAFARGRVLSEDVPFYYLSMPNPFLNGGNLREVISLAQIIKERGIKFVCIDNLGIVKGGAKENDPEMIPVMSNFRFLAESTGAAIVLLHHQRKSSGTGGRAGDSLRGHSSIEAALDLALLVEREEYSNIIRISSTKTRDLEVLPFSAEFEFKHKPGTGELSTAWFNKVEIEDTVSDRAIEKAIIEKVSERPLLNQQGIIKEVKPALQAGINRIRTVLGRLEKSGKILVNEGKRGARLYTID